MPWCELQPALFASALDPNACDITAVGIALAVLDFLTSERRMTRSAGNPSKSVQLPSCGRISLIAHGKHQSSGEEKQALTLCWKYAMSACASKDSATLKQTPGQKKNRAWQCSSTAHLEPEVSCCRCTASEVAR